MSKALSALKWGWSLDPEMNPKWAFFSVHGGRHWPKPGTLFTQDKCTQYVKLSFQRLLLWVWRKMSEPEWDIKKPSVRAWLKCYKHPYKYLWIRNWFCFSDMKSFSVSSYQAACEAVSLAVCIRQPVSLERLFWGHAWQQPTGSLPRQAYPCHISSPISLAARLEHLIHSCAALGRASRHTPPGGALDKSIWLGSSSSERQHGSQGWTSHSAAVGWTSSLSTGDANLLSVFLIPFGSKLAQFIPLLNMRQLHSCF